MNLKERFPYASKTFIELNANGLTCKECGREFSAYPSRDRKFCSLPCAWKNRDRIETTASKQRKERETRICESCGNQFALKLRARKTQRFCSRSCAGKIVGTSKLRTLPRQLPDPKNWQTFNCKFCGKEVTKRKASGSNTNEFCSNKCARQHPEVIKKRVITRMSKPQPNAYSRTIKGWRTINGQRCHFKSRMEANYARYMSLMGVRWEYEPKTFWFTNIKRGVRSYTPDFYLPDVQKYVECKGWMDKRSATKLKRMKKYYPKETVELVDWKRYQSIAKVAKNIVPEWENDK